MRLLFYISLPVLILLSLVVAVIGEILYFPFIPAVLYLHKYSKEFKYFWDIELGMKDCANKVYMFDFIFAGSYLGLYFALNLTAVLFNFGTPFNNGH